MEWKDKISTFKLIDVRGIQGNFFQGLKTQAMQLPAGSGLEIVQSFEPIPLYEVMEGWTNDDRMMIACCNDGTRPVIFKIERIDIPENDEEETWLPIFTACQPLKALTTYSTMILCCVNREESCNISGRSETDVAPAGRKLVGRVRDVL